MKIEVLCSLNSGQFNYDPKEDKGDIVDLPDEQAKSLIAKDLARKVGGATKISEQREPIEVVKKTPKKPQSKGEVK